MRYTREIYLNIIIWILKIMSLKQVPKCYMDFSTGLITPAQLCSFLHFRKIKKTDASFTVYFWKKMPSSPFLNVTDIILIFKQQYNSLNYSRSILKCVCVCVSVSALWARFKEKSWHVSLSNLIKFISMVKKKSLFIFKKFCQIVIKLSLKLR